MPFKEILQVTQNNANEISDWIKILIGGGLVTLAGFIKSLVDGRNAKRLNDVQITQIQEDLETKLWERVKGELEAQYITNTRLREALNKRDERITSLEQGLVERDKKISALEYEIGEKTRRIENLERLIGELRKSETQAETTIRSLREQIAVLQQEIQSLNAERDGLLAERNALLERLSRHSRGDGEKE